MRVCAASLTQIICKVAVSCGFLVWAAFVVHDTTATSQFASADIAAALYRTRETAEAWEAGVPAELIPLAKTQFDVVEAACATVPGSLFDSDKKPATHDKWESITKEKNMEASPLVMQ